MKERHLSRVFQALRRIVAVGLAVGCVSGLAETQFGDVSASASAIYTGTTHHGYAEMRVALENHSPTAAHTIQLIYPDRSYGGYDNGIIRMSRTVTLAPEARETVSLLQPPLPVRGDSLIRVEVDGDDAGVVNAPNANNHCSSWGDSVLPVAFVSRTLDFNRFESIYRKHSTAFTAAMAVGAPDARRGIDGNTWMPATGPVPVSGRRRTGRWRSPASSVEWLELDYATAQEVQRIRIFNTPGQLPAVTVILIGTAGQNLAAISTTGISGPGAIPPPPPDTNIAPVTISEASSSLFNGEAFETTVPCPPLHAAVKTVRLEFTNVRPNSIGIDAVEIAGTAGNYWASEAHASSDANAAMAGTRASGDEAEVLRAESAVTDWSEDWLAYTPFDCIYLAASDVGAMPPAVLGAMGDYLAAGGTVVVAGKADLPAAWRPWNTETIAGGHEYSVGFGHLMAFPGEDFPSDEYVYLKTLRDKTRQAGFYWRTLPEDNKSANEMLPIVQDLRIPARGIVLAMLGFVVLIGPANLVYLNVTKRRTWMLWTIPAISFVTTMLIFAYSLAREGFSPRMRIAGLTLIDQASHHAATIGGTAYYCPLTPSGGLHFDFGTELTPLGQKSEDSAAREMDWSQAQHFQHGWVSARVPAFFHVRRSETRRERVQVLNENGGLELVNGLGAPIKQLWLADANRNLYMAASVSEGDKAGLIPCQATAAKEPSGAQGLLRQITFATSSAMTNYGQFLPPNTYIAVLDGNPFIENALGSASSRKNTSASAVVFGILDTAVNK